MHSVIYHLISAVCLNDSDKWFSLLDIGEPQDPDLNQFLDMHDRVEEILYEMLDVNNAQGVQSHSETVQNLLQQLGNMMFSIQKIKSELNMLVHQMTQQRWAI